MAKVTVILTGDKHINQMLAKLRSTQAKAVIRKAARPALKPVLNAARRLAPEQTGAMKRSIKIRAIARTRKAVGLRVAASQKDFQGPVFYAGFQEWGWKTGKRNTQNRRQIPGRHFLKQAANDKRRSALTIYRNNIRKELLQLARKG